MVFVDRNGRVMEKKPWTVSIMELFAGLWFMIVQFYLTLTAPFRSDSSTNRDAGRVGGWRGSSGGGGGGGGGPGSGGGGGGGKGGGGGFGPNRRIGRIQNSMDCNIPGGGCSSCPQ